MQLRALPTGDKAWHRRYPAAIADAAELLFTELAVVELASDWLMAQGSTTSREAQRRTNLLHFIDLGAGTGKFCLAAASRHPHAYWLGVEHRAELVAVAQSWLAESTSNNCNIEQGDFTRYELADFSGAYLFNPLAELLDARPPLPLPTSAGTAAYRQAQQALYAQLEAAPQGFALVTYFTEATAIPDAFRQNWSAVDGKLCGYIKS